MDNSPGLLERLIADPAAFLDDPEPAIRRLAVASGPHAHASGMLRDEAEEVRAAAAEALAAAGPPAVPDLLAAGADEAASVREAVAFALGEIGDAAAVPWLSTAAGDGDRTVAEAAVAALGAIGDPASLPLLLDLVVSGPPQVRRRCVVALTAFAGDEAEAAIVAARDDRNPMVREAAEAVVGRPVAGCC